MPWAVLDGLHRLVTCDVAVFNDINLAEQQAITVQAVEAGGLHLLGVGENFGPVYPQYWAHRQRFLPSDYTDRSGDVVSVLRWSDFCTTSELNNTPFYTECLRTHGDRFSVSVPMPRPGPGRSRRLFLSRESGPDFGERDLLLLRLRRPHLHEVFVAAERRRSRIPHLTPREREILELVGQGCRSADIASRLFISVGTVRKHVEHIFERTGVRTCSAAVALVLPYAGQATRPEATAPAGRLSRGGSVLPVPAIG